MINRTLSIAIAIAGLALAPSSLPGKTKKPVPASTAKALNKKKTAASTAKGKRSGASKFGKSRSARSSPARPPRQGAPTTDRYVEFQQALADKGYYSGPVNGAWGPESVEALKRFQTEHNLKPDGKLGALSIINLGLGPKREPIGPLTGKPEPIE